MIRSLAIIGATVAYMLCAFAAHHASYQAYICAGHSSSYANSLGAITGALWPVFALFDGVITVLSGDTEDYGCNWKHHGEAGRP